MTFLLPPGIKGLKTVRESYKLGSVMLIILGTMERSGESSSVC